MVLPVYHSFGFSTAAEGDFELLVARLEPRTPPEVGKRDMRVDDVGWGVPDAGEVLGLSGALRAPDSVDTPWANPGRNDFRRGLADLVNQAKRLVGPTTRTTRTWWLCRPSMVAGTRPAAASTRLTAAGSTI